MTTSQLAKIFKARRAGKGKWSARCPSHRDRSPSLEIKEGRKPGVTMVKCHAGCELDAVLAVVGLRMSDLFADSMPDKKALREAEQRRAAEDAERRRKLRAIGRTIDLQQFWRKRANELGKMLMDRPESGRINSLFLSALDKSRMLDESVVNQMCKVYGFKVDYLVWGE